mgnify:CR=1 FL=1
METFLALSIVLIILYIILTVCIKIQMNKLADARAFKIFKLWSYYITIIALIYWFSPISSIVVNIILNLIMVISLYAVNSTIEDERDQPKIKHEIDPLQVVNELTQEYMDLEEKIIEIVNSPKPHSKEQVAAFINYRNRQTNILMDYDSLMY